MAVGRNLGILTLAGASLLLWKPAAAQRGGSGTPAPPSAGGNTGPGANTGTRGSTTGNPTQNPGNQPNANPTPNRPIYLTGRVMMDDGSELPHNIGIERVCGGQPHIEGHTDPKGYFSIQLGGSNVDALQDASSSTFDDFGRPGGGGLNPGGPQNTGGFGNSGGFSERALANCELRASSPGYQSQLLQLAGRTSFDNPEVGTILLHRMAATQGTTVSASTLAAPKNAKKALQKGLELEKKKKKLEEAQASFQQAVQEYPKFAQAWFELGRLQAAQGQFEPARQSFDSAIQADSKFVSPYVEMSVLDLQAQRWQDLADVSDKAVRLDPFSFPQAFFFNAVANYNLNHSDIAEQSARKAQKLDTQHRIPQVSHLLGLILADRHDYAGAAEQMRDYLKFAPQAKDAAAVRSQLEGFEKALAGAAQPAQ